MLLDSLDSPPPTPIPKRPRQLNKLIGSYFAELSDAATYRHAFYLLVLGLLSILSLGALAFALVGAALSPFLIGLPLLLLGAWSLNLLSNLDRHLGQALLKVDLSRQTPLRAPGAWSWLRCVLTEANTYKVLLYSVLKVLYLTFSLMWLMLTFGGGLALMLLPAFIPSLPELSQLFVFDQQRYALSTVSQVLLVPLGFFMTMLGVSSLNLLTRAWMVISYGLLTDYGENASAVRQVAALRAGAATVAFAGSLEETLSRLVEVSLSATTAVSARIHIGERQVTGGLPFELPAQLPNTTDFTYDSLMRIGDGHVLSFAVSPRGELLGHLQALYRTAPSTREMQFWAAVADQAASAADTARLIDQAQLQGSEQERARLARELHDSVAQALYGVSLATRTARALVIKNPQRAAESLDFALTLADGASAEMKALLFALRPDALEEGGLAAALSRLAEMLRLRYQLQVEFDAPNEPVISINAKSTLYRVAQEATHNAVKHARAQHLQLSLREIGQTWTLSIQDDGVGFDPARTRLGSLGLKSMRERAALIGAELSLTSQPQHGTIITLSLPKETA